MPRALSVCPVKDCPTLTTGGRCDEHKRQGDRVRGTARQRGYGAAHATKFRTAVLRRNPRCVCADESHGHGTPCRAASTVADHYPRSRRELVDAGLDPNNPMYGRGLCVSCHSRHTASAQPGGWNTR